MTDQGGQEARIYIAYHNRQPLLSGRHLVPIQVGRALSGEILAGMQGDDTGPNISAQNPDYCELTAHYWAWQNDPHEGPVGLMHYRRLFDLGGRPGPRRYPERYVLDFDAGAYARQVARGLEDSAPIDLLVPAPLHLRYSSRHHYHRFHRRADLEIMRAVVAERHPGFLPDLDRALSGRQLIMGNMFLMSRPVFRHYSALLFDILGETHRRRQPAGKTMPQGYPARYLGFLSERVMTAYVLGAHLRAAFPGIAPRYHAILNIDASVPRQAGLLRLGRLLGQSRLSLQDGLALALRRR